MKGIVASPGIAIGEVFLLEKVNIELDLTPLAEHKIPEEIENLQKAIAKTKQQLEEIKQRTLETLGPEKAEIFNAHIMILDDFSFYKSIAANIKMKKLKAEVALDGAIKEICVMFETIDDEYMRERALDIKDVGTRLLYNLAGVENISLKDLPREVIVVANDLTPSDTVQIENDKVLGFVTELGGRTSHTAIIARTLEIPAVVGVQDITNIVKNGDILIVNGLDGTIIVNPSEDELQKYKQKRQEYIEERKELVKYKNLPAVTRDGRRVEISANIATPADVEGVIKNGAEGIGLFRTEFLYMNRDVLPSEAEQFEAYAEVATKMKEHLVIIRTMDIGGDKNIPYLNFPEELNPFLGWRAIRMCLDKPEILKTQLRAILRASKYGNLAIMYPMITGITEVRKANSILATVKQELRADGISFDEGIKVGIMVETPAAAMIADKIIKEVDFFSIGTNDLTQYTLAVDRCNEKIANLYQPFHPAVLRLIKQVIEASHKYNKWTGMCGEFAGDERGVLLLIGMGLDEFSMGAISIPNIKKTIRNLSFTEMKKVAEKALNMTTPEEVIKYLDTIINRTTLNL